MLSSGLKKKKVKCTINPGEPLADILLYPKVLNNFVYMHITFYNK